MKKVIYGFFILGLAFAVTRCSSNTAGSGSTLTYTAGGAAFKAVDTALGGSEGLISGSVNTTSIGSGITPFSSGLAAKWEVASSYNNPKYNPSECPTSTESSNITLKQYMGTQFESTQKRCNGSSINIFGRLDNAAGIICIMMNKLSAATSAEIASQPDFAFTLDAATKADLIAKCPMMAADLSDETHVPTGTPVTMQFDAPAVTTNYDLKVTILPFNNTVFLKYGGTQINFANNEDNSNGNQRVIVSYDSSAKILKAEYVSKAKYTTDAPLYLHRLYMDETNQEARIMSAIYFGFTSQSDTTPSNKETYVVSGYPSNPTIALSIDTVSMGSIADGTHEACVDGDTGTITNDAPTVSTNSFSCGTTSSVSKAIPYLTAPATVSGQTDDATPTTWWVLSTGSEALNWSTKDNMLTQGL